MGALALGGRQSIRRKALDSKLKYSAREHVVILPNYSKFKRNHIIVSLFTKEDHNNEHELIPNFQIKINL